MRQFFLLFVLIFWKSTISVSSIFHFKFPISAQKTDTQWLLLLQDRARKIDKNYTINGMTLSSLSLGYFCLWAPFFRIRSYNTKLRLDFDKHAKMYQNIALQPLACSLLPLSPHLSLHRI